MTNTTTTRRPSVATMKAAIKKAGIELAADATPKQIVVAFESIGSAPAPAAAPKAPKTAPKAGKKAPAAKSAAPKTAPAPANCACGCGAPTITAKAAFLSGHDARLAGVLGRARGNGNATAEQQEQYRSMTPALQAKVDKIAATAERNANVKAAKIAAKAAAKAAFDAAMATA